MVAELDGITPDLLQCAMETLELDPSREEFDVHACLNRVTEFEYVLPGTHVDAMQILVNAGAMRYRPDVVACYEQDGRFARLETAVAKYAASFFQFSPMQRRAEWIALTSECADLPALGAWLRNLESALDLDVIPNFTAEGHNDFVALCCEAFVMRPPEDIRARQRIAAMYCENPEAWKRVIRLLQVHHGKFVSNVAGWISELSSKVERRVAPVITPREIPDRWIWGGLMAFCLAALTFSVLIAQPVPSTNSQVRSTSASPEFDFTGDLIEYLERRQKDWEKESRNNAFGRLMGIPADATREQEAAILKRLKSNAER